MSTITDSLITLDASTAAALNNTKSASLNNTIAHKATSLLQLKDVTISIGEQILLSHINLHVNAGESVAICGHSGAGKSTLLKAIAHLLPVMPQTKMTDTSANGFTITNNPLRNLWRFVSFWRSRYSGLEWPNSITPDPHATRCFTVTGQMLFNQQELSRLNARQWQQIRGKQLGFMMQSAGENFDERQNVMRHFIEAVHAHDKSVPVRTIKEEALRLIYHMHFAYPERILNQYSYEFSLGMSQRLALALTLILKPQLILADEFTSALDICTRIEVLRLIKELQRTYNFALLFITHSAQEAQFMANRIYTIEKGKVSAKEAHPTPLPESKIA